MKGAGVLRMLWSARKEDAEPRGSAPRGPVRGKNDLFVDRKLDIACSTQQVSFGIKAHTGVSVTLKNPPASPAVPPATLEF